jgi:hypothetical protein
MYGFIGLGIALLALLLGVYSRGVVLALRDGPASNFKEALKWPLWSKRSGREEFRREENL